MRHKLVAIIPYILLSFLIKQKCLTKYVNNILDNPNPRSFNVTKMLLKTEYAISLLFFWAETPEGYEYWNNVNMLYHMELWKKRKNKDGGIGKNVELPQC